MTNHLSAGEHVRDVIGKVRAVPVCRETAALPWIETTRWGTSTRPVVLSKLLYASPVGLYQRGRQATSRSNCTTCHPARSVYSWRSYAVSTRCWHGRQSFCEHSEQSSSCFVQTTYKQHWTYNLRPRRHSLSLTDKTNCNNFINRLLFKDIY